MTVTTEGPFCIGCGRPRSGTINEDQARDPCADCGARNVRYMVTAHENLAVAADTVSTAMRPGQQQRDWRVRWRLAQDKLSFLGRRRKEPRSADAIHAASQELHDFFVLAYHLKDALIKDGVAPRPTVEEAISQSPELSLLADLANSDKHRAPDAGRLPRSGEWPSLDVADQSDGDEWLLKVSIRHGGASRDAIAFSHQVIAAWRKHIDGWT